MKISNQATRTVGILACCLAAEFCLSPAVASARSTPPAQTPAGGTAKKSAVPYVIELYSTTVRMDNGGTGERRTQVHIRINDSAGAKALGTLVFDYDSAYQKFSLAYLRVTEPGGKVVDAKPEATPGMIRDEAAPIAKTAPAFSHLRQAHITLPPLAAGDRLNYEVVIRDVKPIAPHEFWYAHNFVTGQHVLDEEVHIDVPADRPIHLKVAPQFPPTVIREGARKIYSWKRQTPAHPPERKSQKENSGNGDHPPDILVTTFANWQSVGDWLAGNETRAEAASAQLHAKTETLTRRQKTDADKIEALYDFVAKKIAPVPLSLAEAGFRPREAAKVLSGGYGDALDKCALLAAMLRQAGFKSKIAYLPSAAGMDSEPPWPAALTHVVLAVDLGKESDWLDPSSSVLPFRLLLPNLRGKKALLAAVEGASRIVETPLEPPFPSTQRVEVTGRVNSLGVLTARIRYTLRGDNEYPLRMAFHKTPEDEWKQVAQTMASLDGFEGQVTSAKPSDPTATHDPFVIDFTLINPQFLDWSKKNTVVALPLPTFGLPDVPENSAKPIELGSPLDVTVKLSLTLPANDFAQMPVGAGITRDYAQYHSQYDAQEHVVTAERTLRFLARQLPPSRRADYEDFTEAVERDEAQALTVNNIIPGVPDEASSRELMAAGESALKSGHFRNALQLFERVASLNPSQKNLWRDLGLAQLENGKYAEAAAAFQKQLQANPTDDAANNLLGVSLFDQKKFDEAAAAFERQLVLKPLDPNAHAYLGAVYVEQKQFHRAVTELEKALVLSPDNAAIRLRLGQAYLGLGKTQPALDAFEKAKGLSPSPAVANEIAYSLAQHDVALDQARANAKFAVGSAEAALTHLDLRQVSLAQVRNVASLAAYWDTLGWVDFKQGQAKNAESLVRAAWLLEEQSDSASHLAQIYETLGQKGLAIRTYALALATGAAPHGTRERLAKLLGGGAGIDPRVKHAQPELARLRRIPLGRPTAGNGTAEFLVLLAPGAEGPVASGARFLAGDDALASLGGRLRHATFPEYLPAGSEARLVLRGTLACSVQKDACVFTVDRPSDLLRHR